MTDVNDKGWPRAHFRHSSGRRELGLDLYVLLERPLTENDKRAIYRAADALEKELSAESQRLDPDNARWKATWLDEARAMFDKAALTPIHVREIDNEYCGPLCCPHRVWLIVTTPLGAIKVGWRKSVLVIDWTASDLSATAEEIFADEEVTKDGQMIHAWGYAKATEYLARLVGSTGSHPPCPPRPCPACAGAGQFPRFTGRAFDCGNCQGYGVVKDRAGEGG